MVGNPRGAEKLDCLRRSWRVGSWDLMSYDHLRIVLTTMLVVPPSATSPVHMSAFYS